MQLSEAPLRNSIQSKLCTSAEMAESGGVKVSVDLDRFYLPSALSNVEISPVRYFALTPLLNRVRSQASLSLSLTASLTVRRPRQHAVNVSVKLFRRTSPKAVDERCNPLRNSKTGPPLGPTSLPKRATPAALTASTVNVFFSWSSVVQSRRIDISQHAQPADCATEKWISITWGRSIAFLFSFTGIKGQPDYRARRAGWNGKVTRERTEKKKEEKKRKRTRSRVGL